jgi:outer membrane protein OmpA-like peptidoglycan-associated protein
MVVAEDSMSHRCGSHKSHVLRLGLLFAFVLILWSSAAWGQQPVPKYDIFAGYQWLNPGGNVPGGPDGMGGVLPFKVPSMAKGGGVAFGYNFHPNFALEGDIGVNLKDQFDISTYSLGPRFTWRGEGINFFAHTLLGDNHITSPVGARNGIGAILGGGIDIPIVKRISLRLIEADYQWARQNYASTVPANQPDLRHSSFEGARLRTGVVFNFGGEPEVPPSAACSVDHAEVMQGEPVAATVQTSNFNPKHSLTYNWTANGGNVSGKDTTATIDTKGVAGGNYTVTARVADPKEKKNGEATCTANYTVKEPPKNPPTMSCTASPTSLQTGGTSTITCTCTSPDGVPVNVAGWSATGGTVSGSGNTGTLNTTSASPGQITVSATCTDSRGLTANSSAQVTVENPPPPPPKASKLSQCDFPNVKKPWRVDNTCKAILDDVALRMQQEPDAKLVIVGNADPSEKRKDLAAERAVDSKAYLSGGEAKQAIDASRIETRSGNGGTKTAEYWVVPAGATFDSTGTEPVDETKVKAIPDHPAAAAKKKPAKKAQ